MHDNPIIDSDPGLFRKGHRPGKIDRSVILWCSFHSSSTYCASTSEPCEHKGTEGRVLGKVAFSLLLSMSCSDCQWPSSRVSGIGKTYGCDGKAINPPSCGIIELHGLGLYDCDNCDCVPAIAFLLIASGFDCCGSIALHNTVLRR